MRDRLETIHRFRIQLLLSLHERFVVAGQTSAATATAAAAVTTSSWLFGGGGAGGSSADLAYQKSVRDKFPFLELTNPVIFDTAAILLSGESGLLDSGAAALNGKTGTMYVTLDYFMFYTAGGMLFVAHPEIVAVPLRTVALMEVVDSEGVVIACRYAGEDGITVPVSLAQAARTRNSGEEGSTVTTGSSSATKSNSVSIQKADSAGASSGVVLSSGKVIPASARLPHSIRLVDCTGTTDVTVEVKGLTMDYCRRVGDLLDLIVRVCDCLCVLVGLVVLTFVTEHSPEISSTPLACCLVC